MEIYYRIYAQSFCQESNMTLLIIEQPHRKEKIRKTVKELMNDKNLLSKFDARDNFLIGYIAGMECIN